MILVLLLFSGGASLVVLSFTVPPPATLSISDVTLAEDSCQNKSFIFTVTLSELAAKTVTVNYATQDGTAVANKDYVPVAGTLSFTHTMPPNGPHGSYLATITVPLGNYVVSSGTNDARSFSVILSGATHATISKAQGVGTLTSAALSCVPAENAVCFVNYCGATRTCKQVNKSGCGRSWCQRVADGGQDFATCTAAGLWGNKSGDGIADAAKVQGYIDNNCDGVYDAGIDIPLPGADLNKSDVYLHYDYTVASDHSHNPPAQAIQYIVDAFAAHGVNLHIDPQHNAICENAGDAGCITAGTGARVVTLANPTDSACTGPNAVSVHQLRQAFPSLALLKPAYHYMVFGHYATCDPSVDPNTGLPYCDACPNDPENPACGAVLPARPAPGNLGTAEVYGDDAIVATQIFTDIGLLPIPLETWAGLSMHEFGHNLGLLHGGADCYNNKPNYVSVMSYAFYTKGIAVGATPGSIVPKPCLTDADCASAHATPSHCSLATNTCFRIDYNDSTFNDLDESGTTGGINEELGLQGGADNTDISWTRVAGRFVRVPTNGSPIDFNGDGNTTDTNLIYDVNGDLQKTLLTTQDDWTSLQFEYQCQPTFGD